MDTLSLFNGMACGKMALDLVGIQGDYYYSEVDKYGNQLTSALYPNAIPLGDVRDIDCSKLPKIDLLIGGSPCQSFSFAGKRKGMVTKCEIEILSLEQYLELKNSGFEFEGQSYLFWEFVRILNEVKPKYFLLENVIMVEKWRKILSQNVGINPIRINSALLSAQNRDRYYWTNIYAEQQGLFGDLKCMIPQPEDKGILLRDILESEVPEKYFLSEKLIKGFINHTIKKQSEGCGFKFEPQDGSKKGKAVTTKPGTRVDDNFVCISSTQEHATMSINKSTPLTAAMGMGGGHVPMIKKREVRQLSDNNKSDLLICQKIQTKVVVRKNDVDIKGLQELLRNHKNMSCEQISLKLNIPKTKVEHYFRTDNSFAIPDAEIWFKLKELLNIKDSRFDLQITEFIEKDSSFDQSNRMYRIDGKNPTITATSEGNLIFGADYRGDEGVRIRENGKSPTLTSGSKNSGTQLNSLVVFGADYRKDDGLRIRENGKSGTLAARAMNDESCGQLVVKKHQQDELNYIDGKARCLVVGSHGNSNHFTKTVINKSIRRLTPKECLRLQTVPEHLIDKILNLGISDTQIYKMAGNGWTVDVIAHILKHII